MYNKEKILNVLREIRDESKDIRPYVVLAQPRRSRDEVPAQKLDGAHGIHIDVLGISHGFIDVYGEKVDVARNYLIEQSLDSGAKYLFFIGEDTVIPYDGFKILHKTAEENPGTVVCGVYYLKLSDPMITVRVGDWLSVPDVSPGQLLEAWSLGMDCMLIPIEILKRMKEQDPEIPFTCIANGIDGIPFIGEDNFFVHRLHKMGVKILVNTDVQCLHMDLASGKYTAHPSVDLDKYYTNIKITTPLTLEDKKYIDERWLSRLPEGSGSIKSKIRKMIEDGTPVRFNISNSDNKLDGYINIDKFSKNSLLDLNLPENSADEILSSHLIERLPFNKAPELLKKWLGFLKDGGKLILETPNLEEMCRDFSTASAQEKLAISFCIYGTAIDSTEDKYENQYQWGYYPQILSDLLTNVGFKEIKILPAQIPYPGKNFRIEAIK